MATLLTTTDTVAPALPSTEEEAVDLVRAAAAGPRPLHVFGRGSKAHHGPAGPADARGVSLQRLDRLIMHEPGDLVLGVQVGARVADVQAALAKHGQWLAIDPPYADATVGGVLATNSSGPRRLGFGTIKDQLIGLRVLGNTGVVTKSGGRVVKNVTGYDLHKLHVGGFGSLGMLLEANFKVRPLPEVSAAMVLSCADLSLTHRLLLDVWGSALRPVALEALDAGAAAGLRALVAGLPDGHALAVVGVEGSRPVIDRHVREVAAQSRGRAHAQVVLEGAAAAALWAGLRDLPATRARDVVVRVAARPHDLPALLDGFGRANPIASMQVQAGSGIARIALARRDDATDLGALVAGLNARAAERQGYAVVESAPLDLPGRAGLPWGGAGLATGRALKQAFDPRGVWNPGRIAL